MATYEEIYGKRVEVLDADPTLTSAYEGQVWYNSTTGALKTVVSFGSWANGASMSSPRATMAGGGTNTSAITSGENGGNPSDAALAESYNGTGWASETNVPTALGYTNGTGSSSEAYVQAGGGYPSKTGTVLDYDGSSWTSGTAVPGGSPGYIESGMCGPSADALFCGGNNGATTTWERGSGSWTAGGAMANGVYAPTLVGTQTAAISMGGVTYPGGYRDYNQEYNGTGWTSLTVLPATRGYSGGAGIQTLSMMIGGNIPTTVATCLEWDGSSWASIPSLATARNTMCPIGNTVGTAVAAPGNQSPAGTEEYNFGINTVTAAAWAAGTASSTGRYIASGVGSNTAALVYGGVYNPGTSLKNETEEWNGTSWSEQNNLATARFGIGQGIGTQTAALAYGGYTTTIVANTEEYNGASWTSATSMPAAGRIQGGFGTQTAGVSAAGQGSPGKWTNSYEYNGASWTSATAYPTAVEQMAGCGTETAGLITGGSADPGLVSTQNAYNGASWTAGGALLSVLAFQNNNGTQTACQIIGGGTPSYTTSVSTYDGTSVSTAPSLATARGYGRGTTTSGAVTGAIITCGSIPPQPSSNTSEEFTAATETATAKTLTTS